MIGRSQTKSPVTHPLKWGLVVALLLIAATVVVMAGGGSKTPWPHLFYVPVVLAAGIFGTRAGLLTAVAAGLMSGPLMPLDVAAGVAQTPASWVVRMGFFVGIAALVGAGRDRILDLGDAQRRFLSSVSHELRTPLSAVLGFSELLFANYDRLTDDECHEFATLIYQEATELSNVIDHYVLQGRMDHTDLIVDRSPVELDRVIAVVLAGVPKEIRENRIVVRSEHLTVEADPLRVRQIVRSLINNGLAYGGQRIVVDVARDGNSATVTIHDAVDTPIRDGSVHSADGIPAPPLGVGLAVARNLAALMRGDLTYRLSPISFTLRLPIEGPRRKRLRPIASRSV
jgi:signal transduction histidine kinase